MSRSDKPRGECAVCGRMTVLLNDGRIGRHGAAKNQPGPAWPPQLCTGWGQMPTKPADPQ